MLYIQSIQGYVYQPQSCTRNESCIKVLDSNGNRLPWNNGIFTQRFNEECDYKLPDGMVAVFKNFYLSEPDDEIEEIISKNLGYELEDERFEGYLIYGEVKESEAKRRNQGIAYY